MKLEAISGPLNAMMERAGMSGMDIYNPFDDRVNHRATLADLDLGLIRAFLRAIGSDLYKTSTRMDFEALCRQMQIVDGPPEAVFPRNVGLLFFNEEPHKFFPQAQIDVVYFPDGAGGDSFEEKIFRGPLDRMLRESLAYIQSRHLGERVIKHPDRAEAERFYNFPTRRSKKPSPMLSITVSVPLTGAMDLVEGNFTPVDFKSAAARPDPDNAAFDHEIQLVSYQLLLEAATGERPPSLDLVFLVKTKTPQVIRVQSPPADTHRKQRVTALLETAVEVIANDRHHPQPGMHCSWCQYRNECKAWLPGMTAEDVRRAA